MQNRRQQSNKNNILNTEHEQKQGDMRGETTSRNTHCKTMRTST